MTRDAAQDLAVIRAARAGDRRAGEELAGRLVCVPGLLAAINAGRGRRLSADDLEDLAQDVLVLVWQKLDQFRGVGTLKSWVYRFCMLEYRNRIRRVERQSIEGTETAGPATGEPAQSAIDQEEIEAELSRLGAPEEEIVRTSRTRPSVSLPSKKNGRGQAARAARAFLRASQ